ncbi:MAG: SH3 domain-containing protein, partial [Longimicrobiales bacterium]
PPSEDARSETADGVIRGLKRFSWVLIPAHAGSIRLPPIEYAFFDAEAGAYETATTDALSLVVLPAGTSRDGGGESELRGITKEPWGDALGWVRTRWFAAAQLIPLLALLLVIAIRRASRPRQPSRRKLRNERVARFDALRAAAPVEADRSFFGTLASYVRESTAECLDRTDLRTLPGPAFHRALRDSGVGPATCADLSELLARVEHARFAPEPPSSAERTALLEEAERIVERLERDARPARPRGSSAAVGALFIALAAAAPLGAAQGDFATGVTAYQDARYEDARRTFARYVQDAPRDASGWYNLGNAHFAAGDRGHALWAWLRALRLRPRYYAARQNLAAAGAQDAVRWLPPPFVPTTNEAILALALTWWIAAAIMCLAVLGRRKKWFIAAAAVLLVGLVAVAAALPASVHRATAVTIDAATPLLAGPAYQSDRIGTLEQGAPLGVLETLGPWLRVRTSDQTQGWVEADRVGRI